MNQNEIDYRDLAIRQQRIIKNLLEFTITTSSTLETLKASLKELVTPIETLETIHGKLRDDVTLYLLDNEIDVRNTQGGTG